MGCFSENKKNLRDSSRCSGSLADGRVMSANAGASPVFRRRGFYSATGAIALNAEHTELSLERVILCHCLV